MDLSKLVKLVDASKKSFSFISLIAIFISITLAFQNYIFCLKKIEKPMLIFL